VDAQNEKVFRVQFDAYGDLVKKLQQRLGYGMLFPFIQPEQWEFELDFAVHDQRLIALVLVQLMVKEFRDNLRKFTYTWANGFVDPLPQGIPRSWADLRKIPSSGRITGCYVCDPEKRKMALRWKFLRDYGRWKIKNEDSQIMWWTSIFHVPPDVLMFVEFVVTRFENVEQAFLAIDGPGGNQQIALNEFIDGMKVLDFSRFKTDRISRLTAIFRYLDPGGEGQVSLAEWRVLNIICSEIWLTLYEFIQFLERAFDKDLDIAWEALDEDTSGTIDKKEWLECVQRRGFFGAAGVIFNFLDKDAEGSISQDEFETLRTLPDMPEW